MKDLLRTAYDAMDEKLASDLKVIDFRQQSPFVDYFIIGTARNYRMARSITSKTKRPWKATVFGTATLMIPASGF